MTGASWLAPILDPLKPAHQPFYPSLEHVKVCQIWLKPKAKNIETTFIYLLSSGHPSNSSLQQGGRHRHSIHGDHQQQGGAPAWRVVSKREAIRSKHGGPGHRGQGVVQGAHGRILKSSGSGRRLGRWSLGATEERRRGRGFLGHVCERESLIQSVMLHLVSWEFCQCLKRAHAESTRQ